MTVEQRLERALAALMAFDPLEAQRALEGEPIGPATPRARMLWQQCLDALPIVLAEWQRRVTALNAVRAYQELGP